MTDDASQRSPLHAYDSSSEHRDEECLVVSSDASTTPKRTIPLRLKKWKYILQSESNVKRNEEVGKPKAF